MKGPEKMVKYTIETPELEDLMPKHDKLEALLPTVKKVQSHHHLR